MPASDPLVPSTAVSPVLWNDADWTLLFEFWPSEMLKTFVRLNGAIPPTGVGVELVLVDCGFAGFVGS